MSLRRLSLNAAFVGLVLFAAGACSDDPPTAPSGHENVVLEVTLEPHGFGTANSATADSVTITVERVGGELIRRSRLQIKSDAGAELSFEVPVLLPERKPTEVRVVALVTASSDGSVQWSGQQTLQLGASTSRSLTLDVYRGPVWNASIDTLALSAPIDTLFVGDTMSVDVTVSGTTNPVLFWGVSQNGVIEFDAGARRVTATGAGDVNLYVAAGPWSDSVGIHVRARPARVRLTPASIQLSSIGDTASFTAEVIDAIGSPVPGWSVAWSATDATGLESLGDGRFVALRSGLFGVRASVVGMDGVSGTAPVAVEQSPAGLELVAGDKQTGTVGTELASAIVVRVEDLAGEPVKGAAVAWQASGSGGVSEESTTTSASGTASVRWTLGTRVGTDTLTASVGGATVVVTATAKAGPVATITVNIDDAQLDALGASTIVSATAEDAYGNAVSVSPSWSSLSPAVATVSSSGVVTAVGNGTAQIVGTHATVADTVTVTVEQVPSSLVLTSSADTLLGPGETATLSAQVRDANGVAISGASVSFSSLDPTVVTVSGSTATAVAHGTARLVAGVDALRDTIPVFVYHTVTLRTTSGSDGFFGVDIFGSGTDGIWEAYDEDGGLIKADTGEIFGLAFPGALDGTEKTVTLRLADPDEVDNFSAVDAELTGVIPTGLFDLTALDTLVLARNSLSGPIPAEIGSLTNLVQLDLARNAFTSLPVEIGNLSKLQELLIGNNPLNSPLPAAIGNLPSLVRLEFPNASVTGTLPDAFSNLSALQVLNGSSNQLTMLLPDFIGDLTQLVILNLSRNNLTGPLPTTIGNLTNLEELVLNFNQFTGTIPAEIGSLTSLRRLSLGDNYLTSYAPGTLTNLTALEEVNFHHLPLSAGDVDQVLSDLRTNYLNNPRTGVTVTLDGAWTAAPTITGQADASFLVSNGWTVVHN